MVKKASSRRYQLNGFEFSSASEAICGALMVQYLPDFKLIEGETFQVPIGGGKTVDFKFKNLMVEYHHARLKPSKRHLGDFPSANSYKEFKKTLNGMKRDKERQDFVADVREELLEHYYDKRRHAINDHPTHRHAELVVVSSPEEVFEKVIARFSNIKEISKEELEELTNSLFDILEEGEEVSENVEIPIAKD